MGNQLIMPSECVLGTMPATLLQGCIIIITIVLNVTSKKDMLSVTH